MGIDDVLINMCFIQERIPKVVRAVAKEAELSIEVTRGWPLLLIKICISTVLIKVNISRVNQLAM